MTPAQNKKLAEAIEPEPHWTWARARGPRAPESARPDGSWLPGGRPPIPARGPAFCRPESDSLHWRITPDALPGAIWLRESHPTWDRSTPLRCQLRVRCAVVHRPAGRSFPDQAPSGFPSVPAREQRPSSSTDVRRWRSMPESVKRMHVTLQCTALSPGTQKHAETSRG